MQNLEKRYAYSGRNSKRELRRQTLGTVAILLLVLGLSVICAVAYFHARGGFVK